MPSPIAPPLHAADPAVEAAIRRAARAEADAQGWGAYVHAPWCASRCLYCAFTVYIDKQPPFADWATGVAADWAAEAPAFTGTPSAPAAHSIYFGGGTPSLVPPAHIGRIISIIPHQPSAEVTLEVNPGSIDEDGLRALLDAGVNRLSVGVQTFDQDHARRLGRGHGREAARALLAALPRLPLASWSFDLIFALPEQRMAELDADLDALLEVGPPHVSLYGLSFEPGTPLTRLRDVGRLQAADPDLWADMYDRIVERLQGAGYERYEVSNFALPGHRARHNEAVWRGGAYAGLGPSAHGLRPDGARTLRAPELAAWRAHPTGAVERPGPREAAVDRILSTLRHEAGLDLAALDADTGHQPDPDEIARLIRGGALRAGAGRVQLQPHAFPVADGVVRRLVAALRPARAEAHLSKGAP
ncbi:MAG: radical family heme chaperone HemW [Pseudomonadota bacterium]